MGFGWALSSRNGRNSPQFSAALCKGFRELQNAEERRDKVKTQKEQVLR